MLLHYKMITIKIRIFRAQKERKPGINFCFQPKGTGSALLILEQYFKYLHSVKGKVQV